MKNLKKWIAAVVVLGLGAGAFAFTAAASTKPVQMEAGCIYTNPLCPPKHSEG